MNFLGIFFLFLIGTSSVKADGFYGENSRGWHWYEVMPEPEKPEEFAEPKDTAHSQAPQTPTEKVKAYREELEHLLHQAWIDPTPEHLKAYQDKQKDMMHRSKVFSTTWMQNVFQHPELDHTLVSPVNQQARHLQIDLKKEKTLKTIADLSKTYGLFFFFAGSCPYCHQFAPIVKRFAETHGWEVIPISLDGGKVDEFPNAQQDTGFMQLWDIKALPALYAVNPQTQEVIPIAHGLTSLDEMENRIMTLLGDAS